MRPLPDTSPGSDAPQAPPPPPPPPAAPAPDPLAAASAAPHKRGALRRRLRKLRRMRADQFVQLGTLVIDARKRSNGSQPEVVERRAREVAELDREVRELGHAVAPHADRRELASGVAGGCRECGELLSTDDRFCPACGTPTSARRSRPGAAQDEPTPAPEQAAAPPPSAVAPQLPPPAPGSAATDAPPPPPPAPPA